MVTSKEKKNRTAAIKSGSFVVRILGTENGTWQGRIGHIPTGQMQSFRSCLEMLAFMSERVGTWEGKGDDEAHGEDALAN